MFHFLVLIFSVVYVNAQVPALGQCPGPDAVRNFDGARNAANIRVDLPIGSLIGRERKTATGLTYYSYQGIPFAEPPVGTLRFQAPVEKKPWTEVLNATYEKNVCFPLNATTYNADEDCLFVNVYTPVDLSSNKSLPVMFFIHGGGFVWGCSSDLLYGADHLLEKGVVAVTLNYRLGPFGFLSTGDTVVPGNAGLKDQLLALKWTNKYIKYFGGNPDKITIFGQSAGSASVSYHLLSPKSKGLFRAAICESGSALSPWAYNKNQKQISYDLAKALNPDLFPDNSSSKQILEYLQSVPANDLNTAANKISHPLYIELQHGFDFIPVIEIEHEDAFLTKKQYEVLESGSINIVPVMMGFNSEESLFIFQLPDSVQKNLTNLEDNKISLIPVDLNEKPEYKQEIAGLIYSRYAPNSTFIQNPRNMVRYMTDQSFVRSIHKHAQLQSKYGNVWFYKFSYKGVMGGSGIKESVKGFSPDVQHFEELGYIFAFRSDGFNTTDVSLFPKSDILVHERMVKLWTNFDKYMNPTPEKDDILQNITWPQFTENNETYLDIGEFLEVKQHPKSEDMQFWDGIYQKYGSPPYDTY